MNKIFLSLILLSFIIDKFILLLSPLMLILKLINLNKNMGKIKADYSRGNGFPVRYLANKYSGKKVIFVPYEQADYIVMIDTVSNDVNNKSSCFSQRPGTDIVAVSRLGVKLSVLRKLEK